MCVCRIGMAGTRLYLQSIVALQCALVIAMAVGVLWFVSPIDNNNRALSSDCGSHSQYDIMEDFVPWYLLEYSDLVPFSTTTKTGQSRHEHEDHRIEQIMKKHSATIANGGHPDLLLKETMAKIRKFQEPPSLFLHHIVNVPTNNNNSNSNSSMDDWKRQVQILQDEFQEALNALGMLPPDYHHPAVRNRNVQVLTTSPTTTTVLSLQEWKDTLANEDYFDNVLSPGLHLVTGMTVVQEKKKHEEDASRIHEPSTTTTTVILAPKPPADPNVVGCAIWSTRPRELVRAWWITELTGCGSTEEKNNPVMSVPINTTTTSKDLLHHWWKVQIQYLLQELQDYWNEQMSLLDHAPWLQFPTRRYRQILHQWRHDTTEAITTHVPLFQESSSLGRFFSRLYSIVEQDKLIIGGCRPRIEYARATGLSPMHVGALTLSMVLPLIISVCMVGLPREYVRYISLLAKVKQKKAV